MKLETIDQKASYAIGLQIGQQLMESGLIGIDLDALKLAMQDVLANNQPALPLQELHEALRHMHEKATEEKAKQAEKIAQAGKDFLAENIKKDGIKSTESGLQYEVITEGTGSLPKSTDRVQVHYTGQLIDGTIFDSSVQRGQPAEFPVNGVIQGWVEALQLMPEGSKWRLYIPQELAYGAQGAGGSIPPYSTLIFDVELLKVL